MRTPSGLLVPGSTSGLQIFVPGHAADRPTMVCRVPTGPGEVCGTTFRPGEEAAYEGHLRRCARQHAAEIHQQSPRSRVPIMHDPELWDPEYQDHMREVGKRMIREGRLHVKRHER